jgi:1-acyl-sn-glycerol-3-phosphate acyltransferase
MALVDGRTSPPTVYRIIATLSKPVVFGLYRLRVEGAKNLPPDGGFVVAANHSSSFDPWPLGLALYPRQLHFMAKSELYNPLLAPILNGVGAFPVRRGERDPESFRTAVRLAREGGAVAMFPEGTRREKGLWKRRRAEPHPGAARIALAAGVPLVPAAILGTDRLLRLERHTVRFGAPLPVEELADLPRRAAARLATDALMERIGDLERAA